MKNKYFKIGLTIAGVLIVAVLGSIFVNLGSDWFASLATPSQWIPDIVIPIVWTIIYIAFAIVLTLWQLKSDLPKSVIIWLVINGVLNVLWCLFFFTLHLTFVGNITIVLNLIAGFVLFVQIDKYKPIYAYVTALYPIWLSLATTLNLALWILN